MSQDYRVPSTIDDVYWIYAFNEEENYTINRGNSGKWMIFEHIKNIDSIWNKVREATKKGILGNSSKVSTGKPNRNALDVNYKVICVFTADFNNKEDVNRIEKELRLIGIENKLIYKLDRDVGRYENKGNKNLSQTFSYSNKYYSFLENFKLNKHVRFHGINEKKKRKFSYLKLEKNDIEFELQKQELIRLGFHIEKENELDYFYFYE